MIPQVPDGGYHYHGQYDAPNRRTWLNGKWHSDRSLRSGRQGPVLKLDGDDEPLRSTCQEHMEQFYRENPELRECPKGMFGS